MIWLICNRLEDECQIEKFIILENRGPHSNEKAVPTHFQTEKELILELETVQNHYKNIWEITAKIDSYLTWFISILLVNLFIGILHPVNQAVNLMRDRKITRYFVLIPWITLAVFMFLFTFIKLLNIPLYCEKFASHYARRIGSHNRQYVTDQFIRDVRHQFSI